MQPSFDSWDYELPPHGDGAQWPGTKDPFGNEPVGAAIGLVDISKGKGKNFGDFGKGSTNIWDSFDAQEASFDGGHFSGDFNDPPIFGDSTTNLDNIFNSRGDTFGQSDFGKSSFGEFDGTALDDFNSATDVFGGMPPEFATNSDYGNDSFSRSCFDSGKGTFDSGKGMFDSGKSNFEFAKGQSFDSKGDFKGGFDGGSKGSSFDGGKGNSMDLGKGAFSEIKQPFAKSGFTSIASDLGKGLGSFDATKGRSSPASFGKGPGSFAKVTGKGSFDTKAGFSGKPDIASKGGCPGSKGMDFMSGKGSLQGKRDAASTRLAAPPPPPFPSGKGGLTQPGKGGLEGSRPVGTLVPGIVVRPDAPRPSLPLQMIPAPRLSVLAGKGDVGKGSRPTTVPPPAVIEPRNSAMSMSAAATGVQVAPRAVPPPSPFRPPGAHSAPLHLAPPQTSFSTAPSLCPPVMSKHSGVLHRPQVIPAPLPSSGLAPELAALAEAEEGVVDGRIGIIAAPPIIEKKPKLFLLITRLAPEVEEGHVQQILEQCGDVVAWRRARGPSGESLGFGFAQFGDPEAAWKASTCLAKRVLCGQEIKVLVEEQAESLIQQWRSSQQAALKVNSDEELEWELERKAVSCKAAIDAKVEELYGPAESDMNGGASAQRRQELREKEMARIERAQKRKAWREAEYAKELERVETAEKRLRKAEREKDDVDRTKETHDTREREDRELKYAKLEEGGLGMLTNAASPSDRRLLCEMVDKVQAHAKEELFKTELDISHLRSEKVFEKKLRPWLERKIDFCMGGPQSDLVEYVLRRVNASSLPDALISDLSRYLEDNSEPLVERMWRMLLFELTRSGHGPISEGTAVLPT